MALIIQFFLVEAKIVKDIYTPVLDQEGKIPLFKSMDFALTYAMLCSKGALIRDIQAPEKQKTFTYAELMYYGALGGTEIDPFFKLALPKDIVPYLPHMSKAKRK